MYSKQQEQQAYDLLKNNAEMDNRFKGINVDKIIRSVRLPVFSRDEDGNLTPEAQYTENSAKFMLELHKSLDDKYGLPQELFSIIRKLKLNVAGL